MYESSRARLLGAALGLVAVLTVSGCSDDAAKPKPLPSPTGSSSASSPSVTPPTMPPAAKGTSAASAEAFARHYVDLINYAMDVGDTSQMEKLAKPSCSTCFALSKDIDDLYGKNGRVEGGRWRVVGDPRKATRSGGKIVLLQFQVQIQRQAIYSSPGASPSDSMPQNGRLEFQLGRSSDTWLVARMGAFT